ncbi:neurofilament heavy polypeptide-like [Pelobates fuscus]|uniref:neurofilament heavy polypeptide-like n=1 Tax=Pelobates fuscus TaxID=191477 RepID=UPI002FE47392
MGAKLSKKKKGYCLGAGKDGESTETTEVEQKETENQDGQKDAAESNGEKPSTDQTGTSGEEQVAEAEKQSVETPSVESTKDDSDSKVDKMPETNSSETQVEKVESSESSQVKTENTESCSSTTQEKACDGTKGNESTVEKSPIAPVPQKIEEAPDGLKLSVGPQCSEVKDEAVKESKETEDHVAPVEKNPVQETAAADVHVMPSETSKPVAELEKQPATEHTETEPKETNTVPDPVHEEVIKEEVDNLQNSSIPESASDHSKPEPVQDTQSVADVAKSEHVHESIQVTGAEKPELPPDSVEEPVKSEQVQEAPNELDAAEKETVVAVAEEHSDVDGKIEPKEEAEQLPPIVPEPSVLIENGIDQKPSECESQVGDIQNSQVENAETNTQPPKEATEDKAEDVQDLISQNGPTEQCVSLQDELSASTDHGAEGLKMEENKEVEQNVTIPQQAVPDGKEGDGDKTDVPAELSNQENNQTVSNLESVTNTAPELLATDVPDHSVNMLLEEETLNHPKPDEELGKEKGPSDNQQTNDKHLVSNGLPIKEEMKLKEDVENESDKAISDLNGQNHEIVCSE